MGSYVSRMENAQPPPQLPPQQIQLHQPSPNSLLRRAAILNRFRLRVVHEAALRGDNAVAQVASNAAILSQSHHGLGSTLHLQSSIRDNIGSRFFVTTAEVGPAAVTASSDLEITGGISPAGVGFDAHSRSSSPASPSPSPSSSTASLAQAAFAQMVRAESSVPGIGLPVLHANTSLGSASSTTNPQGPPPSHRLPVPIPSHAHYPHPLSRAAAVARVSASPPTSPKGLRPVDSPSPPPGLRLPPSPRLRPLLLQSSSGSGPRPLLAIAAAAAAGGAARADSDGDRDDGADEAMSDADNPEDQVVELDVGVAFPTSEHESRYESSDEPDDVYADFSVIFGGGGGGSGLDDEMEDEDLGDGGTGYEDYMDELDGIPWMAR